MRALIRSLLLLACCSLPAPARYAGVDVEKVPVTRLIANLEEQLQEPGLKPQAVAQLKLNLGRLHAMAWALGKDEVQVRKGTRTPWHGYEPSGIPWDGRPWSPKGGQPETSPTRGDRKHLDEAVRLHREALETDPQNKLAQLGLGWCLLQAGEKAKAVEVLRPLVKAAWEEDQKVDSRHGYAPLLTEEAGRYLIEALDKEQDKDEIAEIEEHVKHLDELPRAVTPLAIPLQGGLGPADLLDPAARVRFAVDGQSPEATWTWITPRAAWLVLLPPDGSRQVRSGLELLGNVSWWLFWSDGFQALAALDDDHDGALRGAELDGLGVWQDRDGDGRCGAGEVQTVAEAGVVALSCLAVPYAHPDVAGWSPGGATFANGEVRPVWDLVLKRKKNGE